MNWPICLSLPANWTVTRLGKLAVRPQKTPWPGPVNAAMWRIVHGQLQWFEESTTQAMRRCYYL
jgi:hypothetical protein